MNIFNLVFLAVILLIIIGGYNLYVSVIKKKNRVLEAFSSIDIQ